MGVTKEMESEKIGMDCKATVARNVHVLARSAVAPASVLGRCRPAQPHEPHEPP